MDTQKRMNLKPVVYVGISALVFMLILSVYGWIQVGPEQKIPVHWGIDGQPDRYGSKFEGLLSIPLVSVFLLALFLVIP
ncbi:MAG TPA: DUF1648 domain-containing protein, partial [bacterium]|nr:DUF1648 domain-containing protein [bacterium]